MNRRFVIGVEGLTKDQERELRDYLASLGAWWHWIENLWFLSTKKEDEDISAEAIRDRIININADAETVVFEFPEDIDWAGSGRLNKQNRRLYDWFKGTWSQD